ncbi:TetR/AcrR family transcriptional regulator [Nocardia sp. NBC_01009]|uniref:TetR/AcrR family transcriptional regulator n=1 Tax=Nocardia sp. NBC_01009 TaxID=2975996 RepID=UPI003864EB23|nr:TetR/AcrR family transcriptional regulator [Nocardia sp. NBC_01009]
MAAARRTGSEPSARPRTSNARRRMTDGAIESLRIHGASATSVDRVLAATGAPRGSVYHHFPGGRTQLITDAVTAAGVLMSEFIESTTRDNDPIAALDEFVGLWRHTLLDSDFRAGCPIFAVAVETNDDAPEFARAAATVFTRWHRALTELLVRHGLAADHAGRLATLTVAAVEGAIALCRVERSTAPLEDTVCELQDHLAAALC